MILKLTQEKEIKTQANTKQIQKLADGCLITLSLLNLNQKSRNGTSEKRTSQRE